MSEPKYLILLIILLVLFGCNNNKKKDFVFDEFKSQIEKKGMKIDSVDETGLIFISQDELTLKISLDNVRRNYERDKDESHISDLVETIVGYSIKIPENWQKAKDNIFISLYPNDDELKEFVHTKITDEFGKVYIHSDSGKLSWISLDDIKNWDISLAELDKQANLNADKLLAETKITFDKIENKKLGLIEVEQTSLKGALLFAPTMKEKIKKDIGFPFYAVIPVRDFCYIFSEKDYEFFAGRIGKVVVDEFKNSGYPITTEILKFTDKGVEAVGQYPVK